ncbi:hypothetical protein EAG_11357 [Camponotus floridanus]|uniref:Uncharacterized protein n=2 Tax=Camponotus floridanus TaxID=104421 RepID=E1ZZ27_CAMFO|nr:hypothetical protein EAG_11357 [Camponotus floridanus]
MRRELYVDNRNNSYFYSINFRLCIKMDIRENIKKVTSLDYIDDNAEFFRLSGLSQAAKDRMMNDRKVKTPKNIHLLEDSDDDKNYVDDNFINNKVKPTFDKHAISAAIKEVNGGRDLSNKYWEKYYMRQIENIINSEKNISEETSDHNNITHEMVNGNIMGNNEYNNDGQVKLVPLYEDPDVFVHPLQMGIDEKKHKDVDFNISRIGKKKKITPQEHFLEATTDDDFNFVKKEKNT